MIVLQIEHDVPNYEGWKKAFDNDPLNRKQSGVKEYRIYRSVEKPNYVIIDLVFESAENAQAMLKALQNLWTKVQGSVMTDPKTRLLEITEFIKL